jgi:hypothetical protein
MNARRLTQSVLNRFDESDLRPPQIALRGFQSGCSLLIQNRCQPVWPSFRFEARGRISQLSFSEIPPSTTSSIPVTYFDSSEARYRQA